MTKEQAIEQLKIALAELEASMGTEEQKETFKFPEKWEDVCNRQEMFYIDAYSEIVSQEIKARTEFKNSLPTKQKAEKYLSAMQLEMIADYCNKFANEGEFLYSAYLEDNKIKPNVHVSVYKFGIIQFNSEEHIKQSFISHRELWLTYLNN